MELAKSTPVQADLVNFDEEPSFQGKQKRIWPEEMEATKVIMGPEKKSR